MVTQHGLPRSRTTTSIGNNNTITTTATAPTRNSPSQTRANGHLRAMSDASSLPPSSQRRNSLPGDTSFPFPGDGEHDDDNHDHSHLDSHITFLDSLDLDSTSTVESEDKSPRVRRLCSDPRNRQPTPVLKPRRTFERRPPPEELPYQRRTASAQSGRSAESRSSTSNSIRGEERFMEGEEVDEKEKSPSVQRAKGPIMGLTASSGRRHRPSLSADVGALEKEVEEEVTGTVAMSAWRRKRLAENEAAAATAVGTGTGTTGKKPVPRSLSAGDYGKEGGEGVIGNGAKKGGMSEEGTNGKDRVNVEFNNGSPSRITGRRVMSMSGAGIGTGTGTGTGAGRSVSGLGPTRRNTEERSSSPEKGKPSSLASQPEATQSSAAAAAVSEAGRAAIAREGVAKERRLRAVTATAPPPAAPDRQRSTSSAGSSASGSASAAAAAISKDAKDAKDRPLPSGSLRTNIPRPSSIPNSPIKPKLSSYGSLSSPSRAKSGLTASLNSNGSPSPRHERTHSAINPSTLQRSTSSASTISSASSSAAAAGPSTSRLQRSNSGASATSAFGSTAVTAAASHRDFIVRNRDPPKLKSFKSGLTQPPPIQEVSQEDLSRRAGILATPDDSREETANPSSRPSSSHSAIYSPIDPPPETLHQEDQHQKILDQLTALRELSPPSSNRSSWSTESAEDPESADPKPRTRRRSNKHKKEDDPSVASARADAIIAEIDSLHQSRGVMNSPPRLSRSKSLDDSFHRTAGDKQTTPPRPRSAGKTIRNNLITPTKLFSPDSEMGEFTARLLRSPAVEDYEDLLAPNSDKEGDDSIHPQRERAPSVPEKHTATTSIDDLINAPKLPKEVIKREIIKTRRPRKEIIKTAIVKPRPVLKYPKRSILEDDSDDSLDYLISNNQDFSALLKTDDSDSDSSEIELLTSKKYTPETTTTQKVRSKDEAHLADREREKERAVHEKLMNRLRTLQLEVRSATRGIEVLEQWLKSPNDSDTSTNSDIMDNINEHEALLLRLRAKQREKLELRILEEERKKSRWPKWLRWVCIVLLVALFWYSVESAIFYHRLPPKYTSVPYQIRPLPRWGTRPTRAIISAVIDITQLPVWIVMNTYFLVRFLFNRLELLWGYLFVALKLASGFIVNGAISCVKSAVNGMGGFASGAVGAVQDIAERMHGGVPTGGVEVKVDVGATAGEGTGGTADWMQAGAGDAWEVPGVGSDQVIY